MGMPGPLQRQEQERAMAQAGTTSPPRSASVSLEDGTFSFYCLAPLYGSTS